MSSRTRQAGILGVAVLLVGAATPPPRVDVAQRAAAPGAVVEGRFAWRRVAEGVHGEAVLAVAVRPEDARLAVGDGRGVRLAEPGGGFRRLLNRGPVRDLAFLREAGTGDADTLLAATAAGLYRVGALRTAALSPAPGENGRSVHRLAVVRDTVVVASDAGAFVSRDTQRWQRLSRQLPLEPVTSVAARLRGEELDCFAVVGRRIWRVALRNGAGGLHEERAVRETLPAAVQGEGPVDVVLDVPGADVVAVFPAAFATRAGDADAWQLVNPALPPGSRARRLHAAHGLLWLATDRGLLVSHSLAGPWQRAAKPAGTADVWDVASDAAALYVAAGPRVLAARPVAVARAEGGAGGHAPPRLRTPEGDPPIEQVHRAALAYLDLRPERLASLRRGASRRGWLPLLSLRVARARDEDRGWDRDETFTSGELRRFVDRERSTARDFEASLTLTWDFGDVLYHPEEIDVSREAREVVKLRDDVLDEVTQLYFERRRVLAELAAAPGLPPPERHRLRLRAAELAAGIDAWTGGWFGRARASAHP